MEITYKKMNHKKQILISVTYEKIIIIHRKSCTKKYIVLAIHKLDQEFLFLSKELCK